jgi:hypothetical protein
MNAMRTLNAVREVILVVAALIFFIGLGLGLIR